MSLSKAVWAELTRFGAGLRAGLLMTTLLFAVTASTAETGVSDREIVIGQSMALSGPLAELGRDIAKGAHAYFDVLNRNGGLHGRQVRLVTMDDGYQPADTARNVRTMLNEHRIFALFNVMGTPNSEAVRPIIDEARIPFFAPFTGAESLRARPFHHVFNVRASYGEETEKLVQHLATVGAQRISVLYQANSMGKDGLAGVERAIGKRSLKVHSSTSILNDASDVDKAVATLEASSPEAIIMITAGKPTVDFIKAYNKVRRGTQFYTLSVMGTAATIKALGQDGVGVVVASVVPFPWNRSIPIVKEYQAAMQEAGHKGYSFLSLEGYINARVLGDAMRRAGKDLTRARLIDAAEQMTSVSLGGFDVHFRKSEHQASRFVELTIIGPGERFIK